MAILSPDEIASLAPGSPLLGASPLNSIAPFLQQAQLIAESPDAAGRPLELKELRDTFRVSKKGIVTPHYYPISKSRSPVLEYNANPKTGRLAIPKWTVTADWEFTRRGRIRVSYPNWQTLRKVRLAYVAGFNFVEPEPGTEDWVRDIKMETLAIAEQLYLDGDSIGNGTRFSAINQFEVRTASGMVGPSARRGDRAKINLRKFRPGFGPL